MARPMGWDRMYTYRGEALDEPENVRDACSLRPTDCRVYLGPS